jgi:hypothetical protein
MFPSNLSKSIDLTDDVAVNNAVRHMSDWHIDQVSLDADKPDKSAKALSDILNAMATPKVSSAAEDKARSLEILAEGDKKANGDLVKPQAQGSVEKLAEAPAPHPPAADPVETLVEEIKKTGVSEMKKNAVSEAQTASAATSTGAASAASIQARNQAAGTLLAETQKMKTTVGGTQVIFVVVY